MPIARANIIMGPAKITFGGATFHSKGDIEVAFNNDTFDISSSIHGKIDERDLNVMATISFEPVGEWEDLSVIWPYGSTNVGASIFGASDSPLVIQSLDGKSYTFHAAAVTRMPSIILSAVKTLIGSIEFTAVRKNNTAWATANSFLTIAANAYTDTALNPEDIITQPYTAAWGAVAPWDSFQTSEGFTVDFDLSLQDVGTDSDGIIDKKFVSLGVMARCIPLGPADSDILAALGIQGTGAARGRSLSARGNDLTISGTGVEVVVKKAAMKQAGYRFGATTLRNGEVGFVATRTAADLSVPLFTVGTGA